jgi:integrase
VATISKYEGKRGVRWQVKIRRQGRTQSASFPTRKLAEDWGRKVENDIALSAYLPEQRKPISHTTAELIDLYMERILPQKAPGTQRKNRFILNWWKNNIGDTPVQNVTTALLEDYKHILSRQKGFTNGTTNLYLNTLSPAFTWAASPRLGWIARSPFTALRRLPTKGRLPLVTNEEIERLLYWCERSKNPLLHIYVRVILATGARREEILRAQWKQVSFTRKTITIMNTKNKEDRVIPIEPGTLEILREYYEERTNDENFATFDSSQKIFPQKTFWGAWRKARQRAGLEWLRLHDCRHVTASRLAEAGADIALIGEILGHKHISSTMIYRHLTERHTAGILEKMAGTMFPKTERGT